MNNNGNDKSFGLFFLFFSSCIVVTLFYVLPVHNFPDLLDIVWSYVFVVNIISMFPHINC